MLDKQSGIILVTVLLFLFIFALLAVAGLSGSQLQWRISNNLAQQNQMLQSVEAGLLAGERLLQNNVRQACVINDLMTDKQTLSGLVGNSCILSYNARPVHYIVQRQVTNTCLLTGIGAYQQALLHKGDIYRITAWIQQFNHPIMILQTTYAKAETASCVNPVNLIKPGRLSWREIEAFN